MTFERRLHPRIEISGPVSLRIAGQTADAQLMNISASGVQLGLSADVVSLMSKNRGEDGSWPVVELNLGTTLQAPDVPSSALHCELVFNRRLNQKEYVGGFRFIAPDLASKEFILALVRSASNGG